MSVINTLITDRKQADVDARNDKGTYSAIDMNRVGSAMNYLAARLREKGYDPHISPKTDWMDGEWVTPADEAVYLGGLAELRKQFTMLESTPQVPADMEDITYSDANNIEKILTDIDTILTTMHKSRLYAAQPLLYCGFAMYMTVEQNPEYAVDSD